MKTKNTQRQARIAYSTRRYEVASGCKPKLHTYARWVFTLGGCPDGGMDSEKWISGPYRDAREEAIATARELGYTVVNLNP